MSKERSSELPSQQQVAPSSQCTIPFGPQRMEKGDHSSAVRRLRSRNITGEVLFGSPPPCLSKPGAQPSSFEYVYYPLFNFSVSSYSFSYRVFFCAAAVVQSPLCGNGLLAVVASGPHFALQPSFDGGCNNCWEAWSQCEGGAVPALIPRTCRRRVYGAQLGGQIQYNGWWVQYFFVFVHLLLYCTGVGV